MARSDLQQLSIIESIIVRTFESCGFRFEYSYVNKSATRLRILSMLMFTWYNHGIIRELAIYPPDNKNHIAFIFMGKLHRIKIDRKKLKKALGRSCHD